MLRIHEVKAHFPTFKILVSLKSISQKLAAKLRSKFCLFAFWGCVRRNVVVVFNIKDSF